jgi:hypothetical protein
VDAIYEGAEFTIVAAAGDARAGLLDVTTTPRKPQPWVELKERSRTTGGALVNNLAASAPDPYFELLGITKGEYGETGKDREWLDLHRHGLRSKVKLDLSEFMKDKEIMETYGISREHLRVFQDFADDFRNSIDEWVVKMKQMAQGDVNSFTGAGALYAKPNHKSSRRASRRCRGYIFYTTKANHKLFQHRKVPTFGPDRG